MEIAKYIEENKINALQNVSVHDIRMDASFHLVDIKKDYKNITVEKYILENTRCTPKKMVDSLKLVHLESEVLSKKCSSLSQSEKLKVELASLLILNVDFIVLSYFDVYFMEKELLFFKKLFKKLVKKYGKTFVFLNGNLSFLFEFADRIVIRKTKKNVVILDCPTFYESELNGFMEQMPIVDFVKYTKEQGKKILEYTDLKELLKAIFRDVQ